MVWRTIKAMTDFAVYGTVMGWYYGSLYMMAAIPLGLIIKGVLWLVI